jgi:alkylation response protein AidB-like acyl-CoA dehydrogenase
VDFELSDDEQLLAEGIRRLCAGRFAMEQLRAGEGRQKLDADAWAALADFGVFSLRLPEDAGGLGLGLGHAAVVFEELGRSLVPGPLVATHVAAGLIPGAATGDVVVGLVRERSGESVVPVLIGDLASLGALVVVDDDGIRLVEPSVLDARPVERPADPLTPLWTVDRLPAGERVADGAAASTLLADFFVLEGALLVGMARATTELAVEYAKVREQFGRPIGSFQAVKHLCADMLVRAETARAAVHAAAVTVDQPEVGDAARASAGAAMLAAEAAVRNAKSSIQVHGGMGFTWEVPVHLYLMRARLLSQSVGPLSALAETVAERF